MTQYAKNNITSFEDLQQLKNEYEAKRKEYMDQEERLAMLDEESPDKIYEPGKSVDIESEQKKAEKLLKEISLTVKDVDFDVTGADITMIVKTTQEVIHL